jgi:DNA-binding MarR family transcriptional regulator
MLRLAHQTLIRSVLSRLSETEFSEVQSSHFAVTQALWDHPKGLRVSALAARARITKQSMGELVDQLVALSYVDRVPDPEDGRARLVRLTTHGWKLARLARQFVRDTEAEWSRRIGTKKLAMLRGTLKELLETETE